MSRTIKWLRVYFYDFTLTDTRLSEVILYTCTLALGGAYIIRRFEGAPASYDFLSYSTSLTGLIGFTSVFTGPLSFRRHAATLVTAVYVANSLYSLSHDEWASVFINTGFSLGAWMIMALLWLQDFSRVPEWD